MRTYTVAVTSTVTEYTEVEAATPEEAAEMGEVPMTCHQCPETSGEAFAVEVFGGDLPPDGLSIFNDWEQLDERYSALRKAAQQAVEALLSADHDVAAVIASLKSAL